MGNQDVFRDHIFSELVHYFVFYYFSSFIYSYFFCSCFSYFLYLGVNLSTNANKNAYTPQFFSRCACDNPISMKMGNAFSLLRASLSTSRACKNCGECTVELKYFLSLCSSGINYANDCSYSGVNDFKQVDKDYGVTAYVKCIIAVYGAR